MLPNFSEPLKEYKLAQFIKLFDIIAKYVSHRKLQEMGYHYLNLQTGYRLNFQIVVGVLTKTKRTCLIPRKGRSSILL